MLGSYLENLKSKCFPNLFEKKTILVNQTRLECLVVGRGEPVLIFHGFGVNSWWMLPIIAPFLHKRKFYIPSMRGHGASEFGELGKAVAIDQILRKDGEKIGKALNIKFKWVVGHSLGVIPALGYLERYGDKSTRYLHIDFPLNFSEDLEPVIEQLIFSIKNQQKFQAPKMGGNLALLLRAVENDFFRSLIEMGVLEPEEARLKERYLEIYKKITILCLERDSLLRKLAKTAPLKVYSYFIPDYRFIESFQRTTIWQGLNIKNLAQKFKGTALIMLTKGDGDFSLLNNNLATILALQEGFKDSSFVFFDTDSHMFHYDRYLEFQKHFRRFLELD